MPRKFRPDSRSSHPICTPAVPRHGTGVRLLSAVDIWHARTDVKMRAACCMSLRSRAVISSKCTSAAHSFKHTIADGFQRAADDVIRVTSVAPFAGAQQCAAIKATTSAVVPSCACDSPREARAEPEWWAVGAHLPLERMAQHSRVQPCATSSSSQQTTSLTRHESHGGLHVRDLKQSNAGGDGCGGRSFCSRGPTVLPSSRQRP